MIDCPSLPAKLAHAKAMAAISTHSNGRALRDKYVPDRTPQLLQMSIVGAQIEQPQATLAACSVGTPRRISWAQLASAERRPMRMSTARSREHMRLA